MQNQMWKAAIILIGLELLTTIADLVFRDQTYEFSITHWVLTILITIALTIISVYLIGKVKENEHHVSTFGFVWRAFISFNLGLLLAILTPIILGIDFELPSFQFTLITSFLQLLFVIVLSWLFYSSNRKGQLIWLSQMFRGIGI